MRPVLHIHTAGDLRALTGTGATVLSSDLHPMGRKILILVQAVPHQNLLAARRLPPVVVNNQKPATPAREHQPEMKS
jgi:hypothetical protein